MSLSFILCRKLIQLHDHITDFLLFLMLKIIFFNKLDNTAECIHVDDFDSLHKNLL